MQFFQQEQRYSQHQEKVEKGKYQPECTEGPKFPSNPYQAVEKGFIVVMASEKDQVTEFIKQTWHESVIPTIEKYISIPNQSPAFDAEWNSNGLQDQVTQLYLDWVHKQPIKGMTIKVVKDADRTPTIFAEIEGTNPNETKEESRSNTILLYGHFDKQPPLTDDWNEGLHPYKPVTIAGRLYGRGGADDGYSFFGAITAIAALQKAGIPHSRCVIIIEGAEESGSPDLMHYVEQLSDEIGTPSLIICLDSGCGNYDQMWLTTSLRGLVAVNVRVDILTEGVHSGKASGIVPSSFRILRLLLDRLEDTQTGNVLLKELHVDIPQTRIDQAHQAAQFLGSEIISQFPWVQGATRTDLPLGELLLNETWRPTVSITGVDGIPATAIAGNVLRPFTTLTLSIRVPPLLKATEAAEFVKQILEKDPPYGAKVQCQITKAGSGWSSPILVPWLDNAVNQASTEIYGKPYVCLGEGGSIPFMGLLGERYPAAQFVVTGVLGPNSNAHGPNEFLDVEYSRKITNCVSSIVVAHTTHSRSH